MIGAFREPQEGERYTYADYAQWNNGKRYELIDGTVFMMSPSPSPTHQEISGELFFQLRGFLEGKPCKVYSSPFDVRLNAAKKDDTVVQPDILVVCDKTKIDDKGCNGAPDMIIEILSPSTASNDRVKKFNSYAAAGVREYWIVDPDEKSLHVCILENNKYTVTAYDHDEIEMVSVQVLEGCQINMKNIFLGSEK